jgi:putative DNA primase/helicase
VVILSAEDNPEDTIKPRLVALEADVSRITIVRARVITTTPEGQILVDPKSFQDLDYWRDVFRRVPDCKLFIVDPLPSYLGRGVNDHKNADLRAILEPFLVDIVERYGLCMLCNTHLNKTMDAKTPMQRVVESIAYGNLARNVHFVVKDPDDSQLRVLTQAKCNNAPSDIPALGFRIETKDLPIGNGEVIETAYPVFEPEPVDITLQEIVNGSPKQSGQSEKEKAAEWLANYLAAGPMESRAAAKEGDEHLGKKWPTDEKKQNARIKWWRESVLKKFLKGWPKKKDFEGPWMFFLPGHERQPFDGFQIEGEHDDASVS